MTIFWIILTINQECIPQKYIRLTRGLVSSFSMSCDSLKSLQLTIKQSFKVRNQKPALCSLRKTEEKKISKNTNYEPPKKYSMTV